MKHAALLAPLPLVVAGAVSLSSDESLTYAPAEDLVLTRTHDSEARFSLTALVIVVQGEEIEIEDELPGLDIDFTEHIVVTDQFLEMGEGRPRELRRTFDELSQSALYTPEGDEGATEIDYGSELEGATVLVTWNEDDEEYVFRPAEDEEIDDDLLDILDEDMDFRGFLPHGKVAEDDSWDLDLEAYLPLAWPGGDLSFTSEDEEEDESDIALHHALREALEAEGKATFVGVSEEDGVRVAVIAFEFETATEAEVELDLDLEGVSSAFRGREMTTSVEGELRWDLEHGRFHSIEATSEGVVVLFERAILDVEGEEFEQAQRQVFTGGGSQSMTTATP